MTKAEGEHVIDTGPNRGDAGFTLAHISDLHLSPLPFLAPRHWNLKRGLGYLNWQRKRRRVHRAEVAAQMVADIRAAAPDHVAVTGDLVNLALPSEFTTALRWLEGLGAPDDVSLVPGNHDIYASKAAADGVGLWADYMLGDDAAGRGAAYLFANGSIDDDFPFVRQRGAVAYVGVNSAEPTPPFVAAGFVPEPALERLGAVLDQLGREGMFRCVLIHHPPLPGLAPPRRALRNADAVARTLARHGAELVLHGHNHRNVTVWGGRDGGRFPVVGISSGSAARKLGEEPLARYNLIRVTRGETGREDGGGDAMPDWRIEITARGLEQPSGPVVQLDRQVLSVGCAAQSREALETEIKTAAQRSNEARA